MSASDRALQLVARRLRSLSAAGPGLASGCNRPPGAQPIMQYQAFRILA